MFGVLRTATPHGLGTWKPRLPLKPLAPRAAAAGGRPPLQQGEGHPCSSRWRRQRQPHRTARLPAEPAIAQRELMRQFFMASRAEDQLKVVAEAGHRLDLSTRCAQLVCGTANGTLSPPACSSLQLLCHLADLSLQGHAAWQPGAAGGTHQHANGKFELLTAIHRCLAPSLPAAQPLQLAPVLWSYAAVGVEANWLDDLLQQAAERELAAGAGRLEAYNTKELTSLLFAYGRLTRHRTPEVLQYCTTLASELLRRWDILPYVKGNFSSTNFADLADTCARLYRVAPAVPPSGPGQQATAMPARDQADEAPVQLPLLPPAVADLLDGIAYEVCRQLANKHSTRSPWTPRDLVRLARAYAALRHHTPRSSQMLDVLSSFCVQRIHSCHLNCVSRPADLAGLLEAYADLLHASVAVPELLAAVGDQVRREAALQAEQAAAAAAAAAPQSEPERVAAGAAVPGQAQRQQQHHEQQQQAAQQASAASSAAGAGPAQPSSGAPALSSQPAAAPLANGFSLPLISSLLDSHLRLGYQPPTLLLQCLAPQILSQLPGCRAGDAAQLLQLLAAARCSPGPAVVSMLQAAAKDGNSSSGGGRSETE